MLDTYMFDNQGCLQLRYIDDGVYRRELRKPGDSISDLPVEVQNEVNLLWTPEYIENWQTENTPEPVPEPTLPPVTLKEVAGVQLIVDQDAWDVTGVERSKGISGAMLIDTDLVWIFFTTPQPDDLYEVVPSVGVTKYPEFLEVSRPNLTEIKLIVQRVQ